MNRFGAAASAATPPFGAWAGFDFGLCGAPRPCHLESGDNHRVLGTVTTTQTQAAVNLRRYRRKQSLGVIVYLAQARHSSYGRDSLALLRRSLSSLMQNYNAVQRDDIMFLHTGDVNKSAQRSILTAVGNDVAARFVQLGAYDFALPPGLPNRSYWTQAAQFSDGYRHMIRLYAIGIWGIVARHGYKYMMRMDEDSFLLDPIKYNVFQRMQDEGRDYVYRAAVWEGGADTAKFFAMVRRYLQSKNVTPTWLLDPCGPNGTAGSAGTQALARSAEKLYYGRCGNIYGFYNNWFATRIGFWLEPDVQTFLAFAAASNTVYTRRWNDILWQSVAVQTYLPRARVRLWRDFSYEHATFRSHAISKNGNILGLDAQAQYLSGQTVRCMSYGGISLGKSPTFQAAWRLYELMNVPVCRSNDHGQKLIRPCLVRLDGQPGGPPIQSIFLGPVNAQGTACDGDLPEPYYCQLHRMGNATVVMRSDLARYAPECACNPGTARTSTYVACFRHHRDKVFRWGNETFGSKWAALPAALGAIGR